MRKAVLGALEVQPSLPARAPDQAFWHSAQERSGRVARSPALRHGARPSVPLLAAKRGSALAYRARPHTLDRLCTRLRSVGDAPPSFVARLGPASKASAARKVCA